MCHAPDVAISETIGQWGIAVWCNDGFQANAYNRLMVTRIGNSRPLHWFLREWREHRGLTQEQLADRLGTSKGQVSKLETGKKKWDEVWVAKCADALNLSDQMAIFRHPDTPTADELLRLATPEQREQAARVIRAIIGPAELPRAS
jgi:transcriptional regulator with XRE-family HTH domain